MKNIIIAVLLLFSAVNAKGQKYANQWHFGNKASLDFNQVPPQKLEGSKNVNTEGVSSISDDEGNLLFYTDGMEVWDKNHNVMPNGQGLNGHYSSTNSGVILKISSTRYFIFTITHSYSDEPSLEYNIVDITANDGNGDVVVKNKVISSEEAIGERICIAEHAEQGKFWLITKETDKSIYHSFLISGESVSLTPIISDVGTLEENTASPYKSLGCIKISHDQKHIAVADHKFGLELYSFNNSTGKLSNAQFLHEGDGYRMYGVEFSYNNRYLYAGANYSDTPYRKDIIQYDLTEPDVRSSERIVAKIDQKGGVGSFQMGPNRKIYITQSATNYLAVINKPDLVAEKCDFVLKAIHMYPGGCLYGLPSYTGNYFTPPEIRYKNTCTGIATNFEAYVIYEYDSLKWDFGEPTSGAANSSNIQEPQHVYQNKGVYTVTLTVYVNGNNEKVTTTIEMEGLPEIFYKTDTQICEGTNVKITLPPTSGNFTWGDGFVGNVRTISQPGNYKLKLESKNCIVEDSVTVSYLKPPNFELGIDTTLCPSATYQIQVNPVWNMIEWEDGSTDFNRIITESGNYIGTVTYLNCKIKDTIKIDYYPPLPLLSLGEDKTICNGNGYRIDAGYEGYYSLVWQNGETGRYNYATLNGQYYVSTVSHKCGQVSDSINLTFYEHDCDLYIPNAFSPNGDGNNDYFMPLGLDAEVVNMQIFTRWGEMIYNDIQPWDGTYKGKPVTQGAYLYVIVYKKGTGVGERKQITKGTVQLIR